MLIHQRNWLEYIAKMLTHLATIFIQDVAEAEHALIGTLVKDKCSDGHQGIEPATRLIDGFTDKVSGIRRLEFFN